MLTPSVFFFKYTATHEIYTYCHTLSLHDALPYCSHHLSDRQVHHTGEVGAEAEDVAAVDEAGDAEPHGAAPTGIEGGDQLGDAVHQRRGDRKSTRLNSSH